MDTWVDWVFGLGWLILILGLAFGVGAGLMGIFHNWLGFSPWLVAGLLSAGYSFNVLSRVVKSLEIKEELKRYKCR